MNSSLRKTKTPALAAHPHMLRHDFRRASCRADMVGVAPVVGACVPLRSLNFTRCRHRHRHTPFIKSSPCRRTFNTAPPPSHTHATKTNESSPRHQLISQRSFILIQLLQMVKHRPKLVLPVSHPRFFGIRHGAKDILHPFQHPRSHCFDSAQRNLNTRVVLSHTSQILTPFPICPTLTPPHSLTQL